MKGSGRQTSIAAMPTRAVSSPLMTPFAEPRGEASGNAVADDLLDEQIAGGDAPGHGEVADRRARQPEEADRTRAGRRKVWRRGG